MTEPPALIAVFSASDLGGSELFNLEFLADVAAAGIEIRAVLPDDGDVARSLRDQGHSVAIVPIPNALTALSRFDLRLGWRAVRAISGLAAYRRRLRAALGDAGPICCMGFRSQLAVGSCSLARDRRVCWVVHEVVPAGPFARIWARAARRADEVFTYSSSAANQPALAARSPRVLGVRFELDAFDALGLPDEIPGCIALIGDLFPLKNHLGLLTVVDDLRRRGHDVRGLLIGRASVASREDAGYVAQVRSAVDETNGVVRLLEGRPGQMPSLIAQADCVAHLSTVPESFGRVCVEAMAAGRPVVAFDHGAVAELVEPGRSGELCPPGDLAAVRAVIERWRADSGLFRELSKGARTQATSRWGSHSRRDTIGAALARFASNGEPAARNDEEN